MNQAIFENIQNEILNEISKAKFSILIAVAWITDEEILKLVCRKALFGLNVEIILINDDINLGSKPILDTLKDAGGKVFFVDQNKFNGIMHNKFCIIDHSVVINGSYNWSKSAGRNNENIIISSDNQLAQNFANEFLNLKRNISKSVQISELNFRQFDLNKFKYTRNEILEDNRDECEDEDNDKNNNISEEEREFYNVDDVANEIIEVISGPKYVIIPTSDHSEDWDQYNTESRIFKRVMKLKKMGFIEIERSETWFNKGFKIKTMSYGGQFVDCLFGFFDKESKFYKSTKIIEVIESYMD